MSILLTYLLTCGLLLIQALGSSSPVSQSKSLSFILFFDTSFFLDKTIRKCHMTAKDNSLQQSERQRSLKQLYDIGQALTIITTHKL